MKNCEIKFNEKYSSIVSVKVNGAQLCNGETPLFEVAVLDIDGNRTQIDTLTAKEIKLKGDTAVFTGYDCGTTVTVRGFSSPSDSLGIDVTVPENLCVEWVDFPRIALKPLVKNGGIGKVLFPYNEGALIDDIDARQYSWFAHHDSGYPSEGSYPVFPNMVFAQFMAYLTGDGGLYYGAHDKNRSVKEIDFYPLNGGVIFRCKTYSGLDMGEKYIQLFPTVLEACGGDWEDAAEIYRGWLLGNMPEDMPKMKDNPRIPDWYSDSPLIVTYCVRGIHDMDEMSPNKLFPYCNALPVVRSISEKTDGKLLVILMHWEGTAPWAPPYVWPPYGGEEPFLAFRDALHKEGHMLGVYCSGFGYTMKSNLTDYSGEKEYYENGYEKGMCASPKQTVEISHICTGQRQGYDICPASETGREILAKAYTPLFRAGIDYAQILDQNHGGGQYFCYSRSHGHPYIPGAWMTKNMQSLLGEWNETAGKMLLGCESSAAEPFIPHLLFSDNRFELNYHFGCAVPLYAYLYHEYVRNFMGNQVSCPFSHDEYTLPFRLAYSFTAGDAMALVLTPDGELMTSWGDHDFTNLPDFDTTISFVASLRRFYKDEAKPWLLDGRMIKPGAYETEEIAFHGCYGDKSITVPAVLSSAWEKDGEKAQIFINHTAYTRVVTLSENGEKISIEPYSAKLIRI